MFGQTEEIGELVTLGERIMQQFNEIIKTRELTKEEKELYDNLKNIYDQA